MSQGVAPSDRAPAEEPLEAGAITCDLSSLNQVSDRRRSDRKSINSWCSFCCVTRSCDIRSVVLRAAPAGNRRRSPLPFPSTGHDVVSCLDQDKGWRGRGPGQSQGEEKLRGLTLTRRTQVLPEESFLCRTKDSQPTSLTLGNRRVLLARHVKRQKYTRIK